MSKLTYLIIHCTASGEKTEINKEALLRMHTGPCDNKDKSVTYKGKKYPSRSALPNESIGGIDIKKIHGRGWSRLGYSDLIDLRGNLINLTPYDQDDDVEAWELTNGVAGMNSICRHVVYAGGVDADNPRKAKDTRNTLQLLAMKNYVKQVVNAHPDILIAGHNQFDGGKICPSFFVPDYLRSIGIPEKNIYNKCPDNILKHFNKK